MTRPATAPEWSLAQKVDARSRRTSVARERLAVLVDALDPSPGPRTTEELVAAASDLLASGDRGHVWLALAVLRASLPLDADVQRVSRAIQLDGSLPALRAALLPSRKLLERGRELRTVEVLQDAVLVDMQHTSHTALATGIQRVARQSAVRWAERHDVTLVGWTSDEQALRRLTPVEREVALHGGAGADQRPGPGDRVLVPWRCTYVLPELATEPRRTARMLALAAWSQSRTGVIGFDCVPLSSAETTAPGMAAAFANNLSAVRQMDRVAAISRAAAGEYDGWRRMLGAVGLSGPEVRPVMLPIEATAAGPDALAAARAELLVDDLPLVLCVGSHEPRKNHLAVLQAAEIAWRAGSRFSLAFVGGNSWGGDEFSREVARSRSAGRPVVTVSAISDDLLWGAYALARCVVFPSLNEGFGLPVAEAIATGTPVITSSFGSMAEIAAHGGALLVDPRDDEDIARALRSLVDDDEVHGRLAAQAAAAPHTTWDDYAEQVWDFLVEDGARP